MHFNCFLLSIIVLVVGKVTLRRDSIEYNIEGLSSLKLLRLTASAREFQFSIKKLPSLIDLSFYTSCTIDQNFVTIFLDQVPYIQQLCFEESHFVPRFLFHDFFLTSSLVTKREKSIRKKALKKYHFVTSDKMWFWYKYKFTFN